MYKKIAILFSSLLLSTFAIAQDESSTAAPVAAATTTTTTETTAAPTETVAAPTATPEACCAKEKAATCAKEVTHAKSHMKKCCHDVLTPEERHHFCEIKCKVLEENPSLKDKKKKRELCDAILKEASKEEGKKPEETSIKPILDKLKKHCQEEHQKKKAEQNTASSVTK